MMMTKASASSSSPLSSARTALTAAANRDANPAMAHNASRSADNDANDDDRPEVIPNPRTTISTATTGQGPPLRPSPPSTIRELLRTRYPAPGTVLLVEGVETGHVSSTRRWRTIRLLLGDGELCVQALLGAGLHRYVDTGEVAVGTYLRLEKFGIESRSLAAASSGGGGTVKGKEAREAKGKAKASGRMVCLIVESMVPVGWNRTLLAMAEKWKVAQVLPEPRGIEHEEKSTKNDPGRREAEQLSASPVANAPAEAAPSGAGVVEHHERAVAPDSEGYTHGTPAVLSEDETTPKAVTETKHMDPATEDIDISDDDDFEVMPVSQLTRKPEPSKYPDQLRQPTTKPAGPKIRLAVDEVQVDDPSINAGLVPPDHHSPSLLLPKPPVRMTLLKAIPTLPYKQNWSVNVLAVVSAMTPVEPASLPPSFAQRQVRLADPTTPKHVLLTVFLDPEGFDPQVGSVVLLLGVKNHMFDGGSLKKYATDRVRGSENVARVLATAAGRGVAGEADGGSTGGGGGGGAWWFENPTQFAWCDVAGLRRWWDSQS